MSEGECEGWTNRETWLVNLHLSNEQSSYSYWKAEAEGHAVRASAAEQVREGLWTIKEAARFYLADQLREELLEALAANEATLYSDLIMSALDRVDWVEIAESWLIDE